MLQVGVVVAFLVASALYAAPSVIATLKGRRRWLLVIALNILLGWSIVGWLLALALALDITPRRPAWTLRARKPRSKLALATGPTPRPDDPIRRDANDPPEVRDDVYAAWLDQGAAIPEQISDAKSS